MKPIHLLAVLYGTLAICLDVAVARRFPHDHETALMLFLGLAVGQLALLSFWCALASGPLSVRLTVTLLAAFALSRPLGHATGDDGALWCTLFCLFCAVTGGGMLATRWLHGLFLAPADPTHADFCPAPRVRAFQYSLGGLLSCMTLSGVVLGLYRHAVFPAHQAWEVAGYGTCLVLIALYTRAVSASHGATSGRLLQVVAACLAASWLMSHMGQPRGMWFFAHIAFLEAIVISAGSAVIQASGDNRKFRPERV